MPPRPDSNLQLIWRLIALGLRHKAYLAAALAVTLIVQVMEVGALVSAGLAIDVLRHHADPAASPPQWPLGLVPEAGAPLMTLLLIVSFTALAFATIGAVGYFLSRWTDELVAQAIIVDLRDRVYRQLQRLPFSFYDTHDSGTIINRVTNDVQTIRAFIQGVLLRAIASIITLIVFAAAMFAIHIWLTLACMAFGIAQVAILFSYARRARPAFRIQRELIDGVIMNLSEGVQGVRVVRAFGREREQIERFEGLSAEARDQRCVIWKMMGNHMPAVSGLSWLAVAMLIGFGGYLVQLGPESGGIALGSIWVFFGLLRTLSTQIEAIIRVAAQMPESLTGAERVFAILDTEPAIASPAQPRSLPPDRVRGEIEFRNVTFGYHADEPVLRDVSFNIEPRETVAIVGPTGSGKSTLLKLMSRFYDPQRGEVLIDGVDVRERDLEELRRSIGFVFQEPYLFSNTIASNIAFGDIAAPMDRIRAAAQLASAEGFIDDLPSGYHTVVGERGVTLSGGERQRISIARATLIDPPILLLDDAMSAVDAATEARIQSALDQSGRDRTVLIVAHRLSTLRRADRVIVIERGRIVAQGVHEILVATDGHYRNAAIAQLEHDEEEIADLK